MEIARKVPSVPKKQEPGIGDIPATLRRHARMSNKQLRFSLFMSTVLIILLAALIIVAQNRVDVIHRNNESAALLKEAMHAERVELTNKLAMNTDYGTAAVDGKRLFVLQEIGQQTGTEGNKLYWLVYCNKDEVKTYEKSMKNYKQLIPLDEEGEKGLYVAVARASEIPDITAALAKQDIDAHFIAVDELGDTPTLTGVSDADRETLAAMFKELTIYNFGYNADQSVRLSRGTKAQIQAKQDERNTLRLYRLILIAALIIAAAFLVSSLKRENTSELKDKSVFRRRRIIILAIAAVLIGGILYVSSLVNAKNDEIVLIDDLIAATDPVTEKAEGAEAAEGAEDAAEKFVYRVGKGKNEKVYTVSFPTPMTGMGAWRAVFYIAAALLMIVCIGILYLFRYEHDLGFPVFNTVLLVVLMAITLYPVLNTVAYSFNDGTDAAKAGIHIWPRVFSTDSYKEVMTPQLYKAAGISAAKTIITTALNLFWTGMLAFALSRREYVLRKFITLVMVMTMYVNAGLIPNFLLVSRTLGLHDTFWVYIIPSMFSCFNMIVLRTYIMGLPNELVESARIDGAGDLRIYWQIIFPLCAPVLATVALFVAVGAWNSWFDTMMYNLKTPDLYTLQYYLMIKVQTAGQTSNLANGSIDAANALSRQSVSSRTVQCATTVVTALPILVIYPFLQRYFVTGMALGSVKG